MVFTTITPAKTIIFIGKEPYIGKATEMNHFSRRCGKEEEMLFCRKQISHENLRCSVKYFQEARAVTLNWTKKNKSYWWDLAN